MTELDKPVTRETHATLFEQGRHRPIIITIEPPDVIGLRLKGTQRTYYLSVEKLYVMAVKASLAAEHRTQKKQAA